jgi:hypothetical protein
VGFISNQRIRFAHFIIFSLSLAHASFGSRHLKKNAPCGALI